MVIASTCDVVCVMTAFYRQCFNELRLLGTDIGSLETVRKMISETHMRSLRV